MNCLNCGVLTEREGHCDQCRSISGAISRVANPRDHASDALIAAVLSHTKVTAEGYLRCDLYGARKAIAAATRRAKTPQAVECEASQSGGEAASPESNRA